jgi:hypothetical protein
MTVGMMTHGPDAWGSVRRPVVTMAPSHSTRNLEGVGVEKAG